MQNLHWVNSFNADGRIGVGDLIEHMVNSKMLQLLWFHISMENMVETNFPLG